MMREGHFSNQFLELPYPSVSNMATSSNRDEGPFLEEKRQLDRYRSLAGDPQVSADQLRQALTKLADHYDKLRRQSQKITKIGDTVQRKLINAQRLLAKKNRILLETQKQLVMKEKMLALNTLTSGIAHEIRNPLNFIINMSRVNQETLSELEALVLQGTRNTANWSHQIVQMVEDLRSSGDIIHKHGLRTEKIVDSLTQLSKRRMGQVLPTNLNQLLDHCLNAVWARFEKDHKLGKPEIERHFHRHMESVSVVPEDFAFVFSQLMVNALEAIGEKAENNASFKGMLCLSSKTLESHLEIRISDNGTGIPQKNRGKIFTPFFTTKSHGHIGLGLSMSFDIVSNGYHGILAFDEERFPMTSFILTLPRNQIDSETPGNPGREQQPVSL